jgi:hypothetical protein
MAESLSRSRPETPERYRSASGVIVQMLRRREAIKQQIIQPCKGGNQTANQVEI